MIVDRYPWLLEPNILTLIIRTLLAFLCAGVIGYDRNAHGSAAGLRTHILVCIGSMLAMCTGEFVSLYYNADANRIGAQVVSGIGFLGAGTIIVHHGHISGLTTAAGLWASACIGLAIGTGFYEAAIVGTAGVFIVERLMRNVSKSILVKHGHYNDKKNSENEDNNVSER